VPVFFCAPRSIGRVNVRPDGNKQCSRCRDVLVAEGNFYPSKKDDGWCGYCIRCTKIKAVEWQKANPKKKAAADARHYRANPERQRKTRERLDRWTAANPERAKLSAAQGTKRYDARHPDRRKASYAKWSRSPKGRAAQRRDREKPERRQYHRERERERRAMLKHQPINVALRLGVPVSLFPWADWKKVVDAFGWCCAYCGKERRKDLTMDHLDPVVKLGARAAHVRGNIVPACRSCNSRKRDRPLEVFCARYGYDPAAIRARAAEPFRAGAPAA